jgi:hypothetical protein
MGNLPLVLLTSLIETLASTWPAEAKEERLLAARAALEALAPRDYMEALLAVRMIAAHHASIDGFSRAMQPGLCDADVVRLRNSAVAAGRAFDAAHRALEKGRAPAPADKPAPSRRKTARDDPPPAHNPLDDFTPEEIAAAEYALDNDPADLARLELEKRVPLYQWQNMTMEERRIAYAPSAMLTPVQIAVLGARLAGMNGSSREPAKE